MKALRRLTVRAAFPPELAKLGDLVANLRWSWHADSIDLFASVDPVLWQQCGHDPGRMLGEVSPQRFAELARDRKFRRRLDDLVDDLNDYLTQPRWYQSLEDDVPASIGYFSPEFGITEVLPQYSGGLGILAGDHLKAASDLGVPIIGVGLLYGAGYFRQSLSRDGWQLEQYPSLDPQGLPITALLDADGAPVKIALALPESRTLHAQVWVAAVGRVPLLLLDSDIEDNDADARQVTDRLYGGGAEHRLEQELLLGIGGVRAIRAYCAATGTPAPSVFHTNEGHAGFLGVERIRELVDAEGLSFDEALQAVRAGTVFTTHTPVPAGIDRFARDLVAAHLTGLVGTGAGSLPAERILALGAEPDPAIFNMAHMGLRLGQRANGVSLLHGEVSRGMFAGLWPGFDETDVPIASVTNGVHAPTWLSREMLELVERTGGPEVFAIDGDWDKVDRAKDEDLWRVRNTLRARLVDEIRRRMRASALQRGMSPAELDWIDGAFDPEVLTIGFARRVPSYKRLTLMLRDPARLKALLLDPQRPVQIVIAGKSHPADDGGKQLIAQMVRFADDPEVRHRITFLPDYDIGMARYLYWGVDVWLNNPLRPLEACGTSGMKAALNGALNLSILDGWWDEWFDGDNGWAIPTADGLGDPERRDDLEANALYDLIRNNVAPRFYDRPAAGDVPTRWVQMVRHTLTSLGPKVLASRMVADYVRTLYAPAGASAQRMAADDYAASKSLAAWRGEVAAAWPAVAVLHVDSQLSSGGDAQVGETLTLRAEVALGGLADSDVTVEAVYGAVDAEDRLVDVSTVPLTSVGTTDGTARYEGEVPLERTGSFGYSVRVLPHNELLASAAELGVVAVA